MNLSASPSLIERLYKNRFVQGKIFKETLLDAETAHEWGMEKLEAMQASRIQRWLAKKFLMYQHPMLKTRVLGINFDNPLGLSAGFDKYGRIYHTAVPLSGFGFCEVGTITKQMQQGNDRPRMLRSAEHQSLWNCMGFNNPGAERTAAAMRASPWSTIPIALSVGKSKVTEGLENILEDYAFTVRLLWEFVDFLVVNISSPNTPGLRELQREEVLIQLIAKVQAVNREMATNFLTTPKPVGFKVSPDETYAELSGTVIAAEKTKADFIIGTNTTMSREGGNGWFIPEHRGGKGGISGQLLKARAFRVQVELCKALKDTGIVFIASGGIGNGQDMFDRISHGASLCQAFSAWPFEGPDFAKRSLKQLVEILKAERFENVSQAVGTAL